MAYHVNISLRLKKLLTCALILVEMLFFSGIHYNYNALTPTLARKGIFGQYCVAARANASVSSASQLANASTTLSPNLPDCSQQDSKFQSAFLVSSVFQASSGIVLGVVLDRIGVRYTKLIGIALSCAGMLLLALLQRGWRSFLLFPGLSCVAIGSQSMLTCNFFMASFYGRHQNQFVTMVSGGFDSSMLVFTLIQYAYNNANIDTSVSFFLLAGCGAAIMLPTALIFLPVHVEDFERSVSSAEWEKQRQQNEQWKVRQEEENGEGKAERSIELDSKVISLKMIVNEEVKEVANERENVAENSVPKDALAEEKSTLAVATPEIQKKEKESSVLETFRSPAYLLQLVTFVLVYYRFIFFLLQMNSQLHLLFPGRLATITTILQTNGLVLCFGFLATQLCGLVMLASKRLVDALKFFKEFDAQLEWVPARTQHSVRSLQRILPFLPAMQICATFSLLISLLVYVRSVPVFYVACGCLMMNRAFLFCINSGFILTNFPLAHFGRAFGFTNFLAAVVSLTQQALLPFSSDPATSTLPTINGVMIVVSSLLFVQPVFYLGRFLVLMRSKPAIRSGTGGGGVGGEVGDETGDNIDKSSCATAPLQPATPLA